MLSGKEKVMIINMAKSHKLRIQIQNGLNETGNGHPSPEEEKSMERLQAAFFILREVAHQLNFGELFDKMTDGKQDGIFMGVKGQPWREYNDDVRVCGIISEFTMDGSFKRDTECLFGKEDMVNEEG